MDSKQLKQEAEEKYAERLEKAGFKVNIKNETYIDGYLDSAEPRELKIAELERENTELREKLKPENCLKLLAKEGYVRFTSDQLDKAKDIMKRFVRLSNSSRSLLGDTWFDTLREAEDFLNSEAEK